MSQSRIAARVFASLFVITLFATVSAPGFAASANPQAPQAAAEKADKKEKPPVAVVNINTGTSVELQTLPGVGAATAQRIIEYRQKNGGFKKIEDLMNVRGIGEKTFLKLKPMITITPPKAFSL